MEVSINPETTQFDRIPDPPQSLAAPLENATMTPFEEAYIPNPL